MIRQGIALAASLLGASLAARPLGAQCAADVQRLVNQRQFDAAKAQLDAQLGRAPSDAAAMHCMGRLLLDKGESDAAVDWLEKAVAADPKNGRHHMWLGLALRAKAQQANPISQAMLGQRMKTELERAIALDPTLVEARATLLQLYAMAPEAMGGSVEKAREQAAEMMKVNPMRAHIGYATIADQQQDYATEEKELLAAITAWPDSEAAYGAAAAFYRRRERFAEAITMSEKQLETMPKDAPVARVSSAHYNLGVALQRRGRADGAKAEFQAALAANPANENARKALAGIP